MTDVPCIMSGSMIRSLLREVREPGTGKTQTRRLAWRETKVDDTEFGRILRESREKVRSSWQSVKPSDRIWVKEAWEELGDGHNKRDVRYKADNEYRDGELKWRSPIHMRRVYSRLTLVVTATRREQLHDITEAGAWAEGICQFVEDGDEVGWDGFSVADCRGLVVNTFGSARNAYACLWDTLHGDGTWDANPAVVAVTFKPVLCNIDRMPAVA
jgi:hypothetical protein